MSPAFLALRAELETIRVKYEPVLEGWRDWRRLNLSAAGQAKADAEIAKYAQFLEAVRNLDNAMEPAAAQGYPTPPRAIFEPELVAELRENRSTLDAAFGTVNEGPGEAVTGSVRLGDPLPVD